MTSFSPSDFLVTQLHQHFTQTKVDKHAAVLMVTINDRVIPITITKMGMQETVQGLKADQINAMANHIIRGLDQIKGALEKDAITSAIAINLDANTISVNGGENFSIEKGGGTSPTEKKESKDPVDVATAKTSVKAKKAVLTKSTLETEKKVLIKEKTALEGTLKRLVETFTEASRDRQKDRVQEQRKKLEEKIEELKNQLERVQTELDQASKEVDQFRDELAGLKQTSLLISIFQQVKDENFKDFFGLNPATPPQKIM